MNRCHQNSRGGNRAGGKLRKLILDGCTRLRDDDLRCLGPAPRLALLSLVGCRRLSAQCVAEALALRGRDTRRGLPKLRELRVSGVTTRFLPDDRPDADMWAAKAEREGGDIANEHLRPVEDASKALARLQRLAVSLDVAGGELCTAPVHDDEDRCWTFVEEMDECDACGYPTCRWCECSDCGGVVCSDKACGECCCSCFDSAAAF